MAKFYGEIGFSVSTETAPGVWTNGITEKKYFGDVIKMSSQWQAGENLNDNMNINNRISILADPFAYQNFHTIKYINWMGAKWKVGSVEVQSPRLILAIGGVYNGQ